MLTIVRYAAEDVMRALALPLQPRSHPPSRPMRELDGALPRFSGALQRDQFERAISGGNRDAIIDRQNLAWRARSRRRGNLDQFQFASKDAGPRIECAIFVVDRAGP